MTDGELFSARTLYRSRRLSLTSFSVLLLVVSLTLLFFTSLNRAFDHDEFEAVHTAWKMSQGEEIYTDFIQHHHPFLYYLLLPLFTFFGDTLAVLSAARLMVFFCLTGTLALTYFIALELYRGQLTAVLSALFLSFVGLYTAKAVEVRPDVFQGFFGLVSAYLVVRFFRTRSPGLLIAGGFAAGVSILFLQKGVVFTGLIGLVLLGRWIFGRGIKLRDGLLFAGSVLAAALPFVVYLLVRGKLPAFIFYNFTYNTVFYRLRGYEYGKLVDNLMDLASTNAIILFLFTLALLLPKARLEWELIFLAAGVFGFALFTGRHNPQYYLLAFPFVAVLAAKGLVAGFAGRKAVAALLLAFVALAPVLGGLRNVRLPTMTPQLARVQYVLDVTDENDYVYDGNIMFNLFRRDIDFIWYTASEPYKAPETLRALLGYDYNVYRAIERYRPKVISTFGVDVRDPRIAAHYRQSPEYPELYLRVP